MLETTRLCIVGLGYVGLPLAYSFIKTNEFDVIGYDISESIVQSIKEGKDHTGLLPDDALVDCRADWQTHPPQADVYFICVPTPDNDGVPDQSYVVAACEAVGAVMPDAGIVVIESTVIPGSTGNIFYEAVLEAKGDYRFSMAYSPERIDPGPQAFECLTKEPKLVAADDPAVLKYLSLIYHRVFNEVCGVGDTRVAELAKCFENAQRDMNIALMNELSTECYTHSVSLPEVIKALRSKPTSPVFNSGLVGGHCIPVDPYYLASFYSNAVKLPSISRRVNKMFIEFVASLPGALNSVNSVLVIGKSYKPNVSDTRNSGALAVVALLEGDNFRVYNYDQLIDDSMDHLRNTVFDYVIGAVNHDIMRGHLVADLFSLAIDCTFLNVGGFTDSQLLRIPNIITI